MNNFQNVVRYAEKALPDILIGMGIGLNALACYDGIKHTPKALEKIKTAEEIKGAELTTKEKIKASWKCYLPSIIELITGDICIIGGSAVYHKRNASLMAICSLSEAALKQYQDKLLEVVGEDKAEEIANGIVEEKLKVEHNKNHHDNNNNDEHSNSHNTIVRTDGVIPCFDEYSGRIFYSRKVDIEKAIVECNKMILDYNEITLNDYYFQLGLEQIDMGNDVGWNSSDRLIDVSFGSHLLGDIPYLSVRFKNRPRVLQVF